MFILAFVANGTGDEGDSISHFLYSRYAFDHPENFLNHWAKPVYVLLTAPVAQGGFIAMKLFNVVLIITSIILMVKVGRILKIRNVWLAVFAMITAPMNIYLTLSGLTEPLFACWMMFGIYLLVKDKFIPAILWISFLPFIRAEGLIVFCVLGIYLLLKKYWYLIPVLSFGHLVYGVVGYFYYGDFWWIFNKSPYATSVSAYGSGDLFHFANKMHNVLGDFLPVLLLIGILAGGIKWFNYHFRKGYFSKEELWLVYGIGVAYFIAHSLFWYLGIFNSFGLMRVMIGVLPLYALIITQGINWLTGFLKSSHQTYAHYTFVTAMVVFLFLRLNYSRYLCQKEIQIGQTQLAEKYKEKYKDYTLYFDAPHLALVFDKDRFDAQQSRYTAQVLSGEPLAKKSIVIWDSWFSKVDLKVPLKSLMDNPKLKLIECEKTGNPKELKQTCLFEVKPEYTNKKLLMFENFETEPSMELLDSSYFKSGKYSRGVGGKNKFSKSFTGWMNAFTHEPHPEIIMSCWAYLPEGIKPETYPAQLVITYESKSKSFSFNKKIIFEKGDLPGWKKVNFSAPVPEYKLISDKIKAYVWNPDNRIIYIDDLRVAWNGGE